MRSIVKTRIGPVPISLVAVLALAAFISAGLWLVPNGQTAEAQGSGDMPVAKCVATDNTTLNPADPSAPVSATNTLNTDRPRVSIAEHCFVTGNMTTVEFANYTSAAETVHLFTDGRITGGTNVKVHLNGTTPAPTAAPTVADVSYYELKIPAKLIGSDAPGKATITVSSNGNPGIILHGYNAVPAADATTGVISTAPNGISVGTAADANASETVAETIVFTPALGTPNSDKSMVNVTGYGDDDDKADVTATFKDAATADFDMSWNAATPGDNTISLSGTTLTASNDGPLGSYLVPGAEITIAAEDGDTTTDGDQEFMGTYMIAGNSRSTVAAVGPVTGSLPLSDGVDVTVTATLSRNVEGAVTVTVGGGDDVMLKSGLAEGKSLTMTARQARTSGTGLEVIGLPKTGNVRVEVSAEFTGDTGTLTEKGYAMRSNDVVDMVSATTYKCKQDDVAAEKMADPGDATSMIADPSMICAVEAMSSTKVSKLTEGATFAPEAMFLIIATVTDSVGNPIEGQSVMVKQTAGPSRSAITAATSDTTSAKGMLRLTATVKDADAADSGDYTLEVKSGSKSADVDVAVSGKAAMISVMCDPTEIPRDTGLTDCTIAVTDSAGNMPHNLGASDSSNRNVTVTVRSAGVQIIGVNALNDVVLDDDGTAKFRILLREDAPTGSITVNVIATVGTAVLTDATTVSYRGTTSTPIANRAPTASGTIADVMMTVGDMPMTVSVLGNFNDADNDALTFSASSSDMGVATVMTNSTLGQVTITAVGEGSATITVGATDGNHGVVTQTFMVTVEAAPDMTLGMPSGLTATAGDGEVMLSWTAGNAASVHWVAGAATDDVRAYQAGEITGAEFQSRVEMVAWTESSADDSHTVTGLTNGTAYTFGVLSGQGSGSDRVWAADWVYTTGTPMASGSGNPPPFGS